MSTEHFQTPFDTSLIDGQLPEKRCVDLEYLLLNLPRSSWVITLEETHEETHTSLGEDLPGGRTRVGKFTGRRRL